MIFLMIFLFIKEGRPHHITLKEVPCAFTRELDSRHVPSDANVGVCSSWFHDISAYENGGAMYCGSSISKCFIEFTTFSLCSTSQTHGGALYYLTSSVGDGDIEINKVCGYKCHASETAKSWGQFIEVDYKGNDSGQNCRFKDSSFSKSVNQFKDGLGGGSYNATCLIKCSTMFNMMNISSNECFRRTAIYCQTSTLMTTPITMEYTSMVNNTANGYSMIWLDYYPKAKYIINKCNVLKNKQKMLSTEGIIYTYALINFNDCCIPANEDDVMFYTIGNPYNYQCGIILNNCTTDAGDEHVGSFECNNKPEKDFIHPLKHIETRNCDAVYEFVGTLTPDVPTTIRKTQQMLQKKVHNIIENMIQYTLLITCFTC